MMNAEWQGVRVLDCRSEQSAPRDLPVTPLHWQANQLRASAWRIPVSDALRDELLQLACFIRDNPVQALQRRPDDFKLPHARQAMVRMKAQLDDGVGLAVLDRLPVDDIDESVLIEIYHLLGQMIGRCVAQKWNGEMIYNVRDTGQAYGYGVRGSHTSVELVFHTDNAFAAAVPDYVGLLCVQPAKSGGISRFCSLYTVHERVRKHDAGALERLYQPMLYDRQKEHAPGAPAVSLAPFFSWRDDRLFARANTSLVRKGYQVADTEPDAALVNALDVVDAVCEDRDLWFEAPLQRGQIQYLNNHEIGHYRSEFEDHEDPARRRHLYRLWHRDSGSVCYDGVSP